MATVKLLIADRREIFRLGLAKIFLGIPGYKVVAVSTCMGNLLEEARELSPDILLIDLESTDGVCIGKIRELSNVLPNIKVVVLTHTSTRSDIIEGFRLGIKGYISKDVSFDELVKAIGLIVQGDVIISSNVADILRSKFDAIHKSTSTAGKSPHVSLSSREQEVINLLGKGLSTNEIAEKLFIARSTVKVHLHNIMEQLEVHTRLQATLEAQKKGLLS